MKDLIQKILSSFDTHTLGFSARKLSAFTIIICVVVAHVKWTALADFSQLTTILTIDYSFIALCLGMTTFEAIKNKQINKENEQV